MAEGYKAGEAWEERTKLSSCNLTENIETSLLDFGKKSSGTMWLRWTSLVAISEGMFGEKNICPPVEFKGGSIVF